MKGHEQPQLGPRVHRHVMQCQGPVPLERTWCHGDKQEKGKGNRDAWGGAQSGTRLQGGCLDNGAHACSSSHFPTEGAVCPSHLQSARELT